MELIINIPEEIYQDTVDGVEDADIAGVPVGKISRAIANGTPLPDDAIIIDAKEQSDYVFVEKAKYNDLVEAASKALIDQIKKSLHEGVTAESDAESEDKE